MNATRRLRRAGGLRVMIFICFLLIALLFSRAGAQADDEFVRQVLEEEAQHYEEYDGGDDDPYQAQQEARLQAEARRKAEEDRIAQEQAEQIRIQREAEFEAELARMDKEQKKKAKRQKRRDGRIVRRVLRAAKKERFYAVLGLRNWDIHIGPLTLFRPDSKAIRRAYRSRALAVHPDKNRDGRAQEAFFAVENAAAVLSDEDMRAFYDEEIMLLRQRRRQEIKRTATMVTDVVRTNVGRASWVFRRILGPFATPILILGCLLV